MRADLWTIIEPIAVDPARKSWKDVLRNLVYHANADGVAWPSVATICAETGYKSEKAVITALQGLKSLGIVSPATGEKKTGRGHFTKWRLSNELSTDVYKLEVQRETIGIEDEEKGEVSTPLSKKGEVTSKKGEVTSKKGEVTSNEEYIRKELVSKSVSTDQKGEVISNSPQIVDNSAEGCLPRLQDKARQVAPAALNDEGKPTVDYLSLCSSLGWKPNDEVTVPNKVALEQARRAVVACAYREGLSVVQAKLFLRWNAGRKWNGVDRSSCVRDLAKLWLAKWQKDSWDEFVEERKRRADAARAREEARARAGCP